MASLESSHKHLVATLGEDDPASLALAARLDKARCVVHGSKPLAQKIFIQGQRLQTLTIKVVKTLARVDACKQEVAKALAKLQELGLENPADLAFAFTGLEQASALGVGAAWMVVRRDAKAFAHTACAQWRGCKPSTGHGQSGNVTPASRLGWMPM